MSFQDFRFQEQQLGHHQIGGGIIHRPYQEDHPLLEQAGIDVVGTLTPTTLLHHHGHQTQ